MPICPRCGKLLTSEQALHYHLNRKFRCGIWNCVNCKENFNTKHQLNIHEIHCNQTNSFKHPSTTKLLDIYNHIPIPIVELHEVTREIISLSPYGQSKFDNLCGKVIDSSRLQNIHDNLYMIRST